MVTALAHRGPVAARDLRVAQDRAGDRVTTGHGRDYVTLGFVTYGWTVTCSACGEETPREVRRYLALERFAEHLATAVPGSSRPASAPR